MKIVHHILKKYLLKYLCLCIGLAFWSIGYTQIEYFSKTHNVIITEKGYEENVFTTGIITSENGTTIDIGYNGLENISDLELTYFDKKSKKVKQKDFITTSINTASFYDGYKLYQYNISQPTKFNLTYKSVGEDLMYLSTLKFYNYYPCDTIIYKLVIPKTHTLKYDLPYPIEGLQIDSISDEYNTTFLFKVIENTSIPLGKYKGTKSKSVFNNNLYKTVRIQISKSQNKDQELNNWYSKLIEKVGVLNESSKREIDSIVDGLTEQDEIIKTLFKYVQSKIRYIDIEDGISAFKPRNVNDILNKKQGDCKDMSNLITQALIYKGFDARMALSSSLNHRYNLNFPNIASANHVVCVVNRNEEWIMLDATDKYCKYLQPSSHTQNRNIFILNDSNSFYHKVKAISYAQNLDSLNLKYSIKDGTLKAKAIIEKNGLANKTYYSVKDYYSEAQFEDWFNEKIKDEFIGYNIDSITYQINEDKTSINLNLVQDKKSLTSIKSRNYIPINSLISYPHQFAKKLSSDEKLVTYQTIYKKVIASLEFEEEVNLINHIDTSFKKENLSFTFKVELVNSNTINLNYTLIINEIEIQNDIVSSYNELNNEIINILNKSVIYEVVGE